MKKLILLLACASLLSCIRTDMDLKTLQDIISKSYYTNKLNINDEMKFYRSDGKRDINFENYLIKNNALTLVSGDFNHDGEEDYILLLSKDPENENRITKDTFRFENNNIMMFDKNTIK